MNCRITRSQKARANERQKYLLNVIAEQNLLIRNGQTGYMWALTVAQMYDCGLFTFDEAIELIGVSLFSDVFLAKVKNLFADIDNEDDDFVYEYNTSNLRIGMVIKTHDELCKLLEVRPKKVGKSKQLQERDFLRYFDYEKLSYGHGYLILDIYERDEIIPKNANARNSLYNNQLKVLILLLISTQKKNESGNRILYTTYPRLRKQMKIINPKFDKIQLADLISGRDQYATWLSDSEAEYQEKLFRSQTDEKYKNSIRNSLNNLEDGDLIHYEAYNKICYYDDDNNWVERRATPDEEMYIHNLKQEIAEQLGYPRTLYARRFKQSEFDRLYCERYNAEQGWEMIYYCLEAMSNDKALSTPIKNFTIFKDWDFSVFDLSDELKDKLRLEYNGNLVQALHKQISKSTDFEKNKLLNWCKTQSEKFRDYDDNELLENIIPQFSKMKHYTSECNSYRDYLVDSMVKLTDIDFTDKSVT